MAIKDTAHLWKRYYQRNYARKTRERRLMLKKLRKGLGVKSGAFLLNHAPCNDPSGPQN